MEGRASAVPEGWVHSTETFGTADGPGIRYVLFLSGCPLRCVYCHNPDTWHRRDGTLTAVEDILSDIGKYRNFFGRGRGRGGVTLSGGEPLVQPKFCKAILRGCKEMGVHTALDTSGYLGRQADDALLDDVDLVLLDIKAASGNKYKSLTGVAIDQTIRFAERLANRHQPVWLRYVLVPGLTDSLDDIESMATFAAGLGNIERVDVLPFHQMGEHKWRELGLQYKLAGTRAPSPEVVTKAREVFRAAGLLVS
jgi:pyruvate formate lyase activating enzyme